MNASSDKAELVPVGGGDPIPLIRSPMTLGRRESCDICLRFPNISGQHCELVQVDGIWHLHDLGSTNGTKVNGQQVQKKMLRPGDEITIAKRRFAIQYTLPPGASFFVEEEDISQSLLEKAGLARSPRPPVRRRPPSSDEEGDLEMTP